jgi:2-polyprenyl-6-hydroxyphenyl methylase/3-demethylubiquinone-9 3-methyltransferase
MPTPDRAAPADGFDHGTDERFFAYYARESLSPRTLERFATVRDKALRLLERDRRRPGPLAIADIGCGAGTQSLMWAALGHAVHGLDVNAPLIEEARRRARDAGAVVHFDVGTATALPYDDAAMDVVLMPELLEHVADWVACVDEAVRVLRPGGVLYLSTTNALCPVQQEFQLPLYSWYPARLKRRYERLAVTKRPELANHAKYPAVHWFTFYGLRAHLARRGVRSLDRFDMIDVAGRGRAARVLVGMVRALPPLRLLGHVATPGTTLFGLKGHP